MSKIGIYITGLGQSFQQESIEKYAAIFKNELNVNSDDVYCCKIEKVHYTDDQISTVVNIINQSKNDEIVYKFYEFKYNDLLTEKFSTYNIFLKNLFLLFLVVRKFPLLFIRLFKSESYRRAGQTFYVFGIFFMISMAIIFLLPSLILFVNKIDVPNDIKNHYLLKIVDCLTKISTVFVPIITFLLLIIPQSKALVTTLATEFACADGYIQFGDQGQLILGDLDLLIDYIQVHEKNSKIHIHSYSFGSILALDLLFPIGNDPSKNNKNLIELLITVATPYEFIEAYYPGFYLNRNLELQDSIKWLNVYSISDALATNFRKDALIGPAEFGLKNATLLPINVNYEIAQTQKKSIFNFITLHHLKMHRIYWDDSIQGQSCMRKICNEMVGLNLF